MFFRAEDWGGCFGERIGAAFVGGEAGEDGDDEGVCGLEEKAAASVFLEKGGDFGKQRLEQVMRRV